MKRALQARQMLGKYRIDRRLAQGGFADVYQGTDTIEGVRVALKIPHSPIVDDEMLEEFRKEARLTARLDHPNVLPIKNAAMIDGHFVIVYPLGERSLADRLTRRISIKTAMNYGEQLLEALAYAHSNRIIHCDIKPENLILFRGGRLRLADFGIAKVAFYTMSASGSGTVGYMSPEQAMGKPSFRSDVFSAGLLLYRMFSGHLPEWPFEWPPPRYQQLRSKLPPQMLELLRRSVEIQPLKRFENALAMLTAFQRLKPTTFQHLSGQRRRRRRARDPRHDWSDIRRRQFLRGFRRPLEIRGECHRCQGPISETMQACPWCGSGLKVHRDPARFSRRCPRCKRGLKSDWRFCAWCFGGAVNDPGPRSYTDRRYTGRCSNPDCARKELMPFMRYCPWCRRKVKKNWPIDGSKSRCTSCGWGSLPEFWDFCPWCGVSQAKR